MRGWFALALQLLLLLMVVVAGCMSECEKNCKPMLGGPTCKEICANEDNRD